MKTTVFLCAALGLALLAGGCGPTREQIQMGRAMYARIDRDADYNASARFLQKYCAARDKDYVMWGMDYASLCLMGGNYDAAKAELLKVHADITKAEDKTKETVAAIANESAKIFKGEPFERAMVCCYLGLLHYMDEDYNNGRIFFAQGDMADATTEDDMKDFRNDFGLAHYWLGRSFLRLNQPDNARVAFQKASVHVPRKGEESETASLRKAQARERERRIPLEKKCFQNATSAKPPVVGAADLSNCCLEAELPSALPAGPPASPALPAAGAAESPVLLAAQNAQQFFSVDFQKEVNLILVIETGVGPIKYLIGENGFMDAIRRGGYSERKLMVYLDGQKAGPAQPLLDMFHQADTRGTSEKDRAQIAKGVSQSVLRRMPYVGSVAALWNVRADHRFWHLIPGEVHVYAAKVRPGRYSVTLQCLDSNGALLPRYRVTRYHVPVREGQENVYLLHTYPEADNAVPVDPKANQDARVNYGAFILMYQHQR